MWNSDWLVFAQQRLLAGSNIIQNITKYAYGSSQFLIAWGKQCDKDLSMKHET